MKEQINELLLKMQTGENCIVETASHLLNLFGISCDYEFLIKQVGEREFILLKKFKKETKKGYFWWKKIIIKQDYQMVDKYGETLFIRRGITNIRDMIEYETKEEAENWIANYKKYPIYYYC